MNIMPRPKGSKSLGIPKRGMPEVIDIAKVLFQRAGDNTFSFSDFKEFLSLEKAAATPLVGILSSDYGIIEKAEGGWKLSDLGRRIANDDFNAVKESFIRNPIFNDLTSRFEGKSITAGVIIDYLKKKYKKGENVLIIAQRFMEMMGYVKPVEGVPVGSPEDNQFPDKNISRWFRVFQLKYALTSPKEDIKKLAESIENEFKNDKDEGIRTTAESIMENKSKEEILKVLVDNLIKIASKKYPNIILYFEKENPSKNEGLESKTDK